jgi:GNAT superfamily N-acetyltransferase
MEPFEIRRCQTGEIESVTRMWRRTRDDARPKLEARMGYSASDDLAFFENVLMKTCAVWIITRDARPVGLLALKNDSIEQLYIDPAEQGKGLGSALIDFSKRSSPRRLELYTHVWNNNARRFYEHHGFRATKFGTSPAPESEPDVKYVWSGERQSRNATRPGH